jgi:putative ABC transport system permease protein
MQALNRKLIRDVWHLRGQTVAVALVVACGIASFVTMQSAYRSLKLTQAAYYEAYRFANLFAHLKRAPQSLARRLATIPGVVAVDTRVVVDVTLDVPGLREPASGRVISLPPYRPPTLNDLYLQWGRYLRSGHRDEVMVSVAFATANGLALGDRIGAVLNGRWESLRVVGIVLSPEYIYEIKGAGSLFPDNKRFGVLWMEQESLAAAFDMEGAFNDVALALAPGVDEPEVIAQVDRYLAPYGGLGAYSRYHQISNRYITDEITSLKGIAIVVPSVFLAVAAFLLNVVLSRLVRTERQQIAIMKAFGYHNRVIAWHYLKLALLMTGFGAALGVGLGIWFGSAVTANYARFFHFPILHFELEAHLFVSSLLISFAAATVGALSAVRQAVALPPAEGMRPAPPAHYQPAALERLGLQGWVPPLWRMVIRQLERKPMQNLLSILGIALALAIVILGRYFVDAIQYMMMVQFQYVQREEVSVVFEQPRPQRSQYELAALAGVLRVEPFRQVTARLQFGPRERRLSVTGMEPGGELRRLIDRHLRQVTLAQAGLILTAKLAQILDIVPGQKLTIEVLEGRRPTWQVTVVGLVDELIGIAAYMDIHSLNRLMLEGSVISGTYLAVDPMQAGDLYRSLKRMPAIAGVGLRQAALSGFQNTIAESMRVFNTVLGSFACIIAFGVVYNVARIALSERGRELASLRIMGFSRAEIAMLLLAEQAVLVILALPIGILLGWGFAALMPYAFAYTSELYRLPVVINPATFAMACMVVIAAAIISGLVVRQRLHHMDLIAVLKTRE